MFVRGTALEATMASGTDHCKMNILLVPIVLVQLLNKIMAQHKQKADLETYNGSDEELFFDPTFVEE